MQQGKSWTGRGHSTNTYRQLYHLWEISSVSSLVQFQFQHAFGVTEEVVAPGGRSCRYKEKQIKETPQRMAVARLFWIEDTTHCSTVLLVKI